MLRVFPRSYRTPSGKIYRLYKDLSDRPHVLIAGATGSGKSVVLNGIIQAVLMTESPFNAQFVLIDPKKVELMDYKELPHTVRYADEPGRIIDSLEWTIQELDRRFSVMQRKGIKEYDGSVLYVIIDELADLMTSMKNETLPLLQRIAQIGRAANVRIIACSQNILAQTIPTVLKCNFSTILGLRTATKAHSRYLIDSAGCETLPDPKRTGTAFGYLRDGADLTKYQLYMWPTEELRKLVDYWKSPACIAG